MRTKEEAWSRGYGSRSAGFAFALSFVGSLLLLGCSPKVRHYSAREAVDAIQVKAAEVLTERGRAWINARTPQQKISFPAVIVVDRTNAAKPLMRIECMDPFGATHVLMMLDEKGELTLADYDQRQVYRQHGTWYGLPLARLPELLLGFSRLPDEGRVGEANSDGFLVRSGKNSFRFIMSWIDPGPRLALSGIEAELADPARGASSKYIVEYSHYLDKDDFYLPQDVKAQGFESTSAEPTIELSVAWRERRWNEKIPSGVFKLPSAIQGFSRQ